jgi:hypothetical protein
MNEILRPDCVDSLGKLNEWLDECGMLQRDCVDAEIGTTVCSNAQIWKFDREFPSADRCAANAAHRALIDRASGLLWGYLTGIETGQRLVWRIRPEVSESSVRNRRVVQFYARFWLEPQA